MSYFNVKELNAIAGLNLKMLLLSKSLKELSIVAKILIQALLCVASKIKRKENKFMHASMKTQNKLTLRVIIHLIHRMHYNFIKERLIKQRYKLLKRKR